MVKNSSFYSITKTLDELSIVCSQDRDIANAINALANEKYELLQGIKQMAIFLIL